MSEYLGTLSRVENKQDGLYWCNYMIVREAKGKHVHLYKSLEYYLDGY